MPDTVLDQAAHSPHDVMWHTGSDPLKPGQWIPWRDVSPKSYHPDDEQIVIVAYTSGPGLVAKTNREAILEAFPDHDDVFEVGGDAIAFRATSDDDELIEVMEALENHPLWDDDRHSMMEVEAQDEAWESWARSDFERGLERKYDDEEGWEDVVEDLTEDQLYELFRKGQEQANVYWHEDGDSGDMYISLDRVLDELTSHDVINVLVCEAERAAQLDLCEIIGRAGCAVGTGPQLRAVVRALWFEGVQPQAVVPPFDEAASARELKQVGVSDADVQRVYNRLTADPDLEERYLSEASRWMTLYWASHAMGMDDDDAAGFIADSWDEISAALPEKDDDD